MSEKEIIRKAYEAGEGTFKTLAVSYGASDGTIKSWAGRDRDKGQPWKKPKNKKVAEKVAEKVEVKNLALKDNEKIVSELTKKQRFFVAEYLKDFNATRAAITVGYSKNSASEQGYQMLHKTSIQQEIKKQTEALFDNLGLTPQRIIMEYLKIAGSDITDYLSFGKKEVKVMGAFGPVLDKKGNPVMKTISYVDFKESSEVDTTLISEVKQGKDGVSIKLYDKMKALDMLAKYMNLITDGVNIKVQQNNVIMNMSEDEIKNRIGKLLG